MEKQGFLENLRKTWYAMTMKNKINVFIGAVFMTMALSLLLNIWVAKFSIVDFNHILNENAKNSELVQALEVESGLFAEYVKSPNEETKRLLEEAKNRTYNAVYDLSYDYGEIGEERYAKTWSIRNAYGVYVEKRNLVLASGGESENYIRELYEVYNMQGYLQRYAGDLMSMTIEAGNDSYKEKLPNLTTVPIVAMVLALFLFWGMLATSRMMHRAIVIPVMKLADTARRIANNDFFVEDVKVENKDELGDLVRAFNKMKFATSEYIVALEEKRKTLDLLHQEELEKMAMGRELENMKFDLLKNQINPHFLFNTLNVIAGMANLEDAEVSEKMIRALSDLFRYNLKTKEAEVPVFTFQPIVENAIIHGICKKEEGGIIRIRIREDEKRLYITIGDTGVGIDEASVVKMRQQIGQNAEYQGIGIGNVSRRVKAMYQDGEVEIYSKEGVGTVVKLVLPRRGEM